MEWTDKPVIVSHHAVVSYLRRVMFSGESPSYKEAKRTLAAMVTEDNFHHRLPSGAFEFWAGNVRLVVKELDYVNKIVTVKGSKSTENKLRYLQGQLRDVQKALDKRRKRWLG